MRKLGLILTGLLAVAGIVSAERSPVQPLTFPPGSRDVVYVIPQFSAFEEISENELHFLRKTLDRAAEERVKAVIIELDTPGGDVMTAFKYLSVMERSEVPVVVYLNPHGISAGMIIAVGGDRIAMSPNGIIGDAMALEVGPGGVRPIVPARENAPPEGSEAPEPSEAPASEESDTPDLLREIERLGARKPAGSDAENQRLADEKFLSVFYKILEVQAEKNDRPVRVIRAMADPYLTLTEAQDGIEHAGASPLTLGGRDAYRLGVVDYLVSSRADLLNQLGVGDAEVVEVRRSHVEQIGSLLAHPVVAGLLLMLGIVGLFVEIRTPGFGVAGVLGILFLTLFFLGHIASGASEWGPMVVFFVGVLLLAIEIFVIPGFGLVGVTGILCMGISVFWAFGFENVGNAVQVVVISLVAAIGVITVLTLYVLPKTPMFRRSMLSTATSSKEGFTAFSEDVTLVGSLGVTLTPLRPTGTVAIDGKRHDAVSQGEFLDAGKAVKVIALNGFQLVVEEHSETA